jgi:hypothetical protein
VNEPRGEDGARACARKGEDNADDDEQRDLRISGPELRGVHSAEKNASDDDASGDAPFARENRIKEAAKDGFLDERRDEDAEGHEPEDVCARAEELLDGEVLFFTGDLRSGADGDREKDAAEDTRQILRGEAETTRRQPPPTQGGPEGRAVVHANHHEEKSEKDDVPGGLEADGETRVGSEAFDKLIGSYVEICGHEKRKSDFHHKEAGDGKTEEEEKFAAAPGRANVLGEIFLRGRLLWQRELRKCGGGGFWFGRWSVVRRKGRLGIGESHRDGLEERRRDDWEPHGVSRLDAGSCPTETLLGREMSG